MYHRINKPKCAAQLEKLVQLARTTVAFGLDNEATIARGYRGPVLPQQRLANGLGNRFLKRHGGLRFLTAVRACFLDHFERYGNRAAGEWLWDRPVSIAAPVVQLLVIPVAQKRGILDAFDANADLEARFAAGHFIPLPATVSAEAWQSVKTILSNFYQDILADSSVPGYVLGEAEQLDRQVFLQGFRRANDHLRVCPGCDSDRPSGADGRVHADADHFFPQSKYPFLTVHPLNLTPFCKACNQDYKGGSDALAAPGVTGLMDIYHPYLLPAQGEIEVKVEPDPADGQPRLHLRSRTNDAQHTARLNSIAYLFNLEARWQMWLAEDDLDANLESALRYSTEDERQKADFQPEDNWLRAKLTTIAEDMQHDISKIPRATSTQAYAYWLASAQFDARAKWLDFVKSLRTTSPSQSMRL